MPNPRLALPRVASLSLRGTGLVGTGRARKRCGVVVKDVVLVVDDDPVARDLLGGELERSGFLVARAVDGADGWERFRREQPDLVVTDLRMPRADGIDLIRRIRSEADCWVPVIAITSHDDARILEMVFEAGRGAATRFLALRPGLDRLAEVARELLAVNVPALREQRRRLRYQELSSLLQEHGGNVSRVARAMGCDRQTIYYWMKSFGMYPARAGRAPRRETRA